MPADCPVCGAEIVDVPASFEDGCPSCNADPREMLREARA